MNKAFQTAQDRERLAWSVSNRASKMRKRRLRSFPKFILAVLSRALIELLRLPRNALRSSRWLLLRFPIVT